MIWKLKTYAFRILSALPKGEALYRFIQKNLTRSLVPTPERIGNKVEVAIRYWDWISKNGYEAQARAGLHLDFGAGWHPTIPFIFQALGVKKQRLLDLVPVIDKKLLCDGLEILRTHGRSLLNNAGIGPLIDGAFPIQGTTVPEILAAAGIQYNAPYGNLLQSLGGQAAMVTSTQVLLHIPEQALMRCFTDIFHALQPGGIFMATIHLHPLYGGLTTDESSYRHLRYSPEEWEKFGSNLMYYSRLKAPDYRRLLEGAGFELPGWEINPGEASDYAALERMPIHECFSKYSRDDLAARHLSFAARKPLAN